jgi:hypothetical protein
LFGLALIWLDTAMLGTILIAIGIAGVGIIRTEEGRSK